MKMTEALSFTFCLSHASHDVGTELRHRIKD